MGDPVIRYILKIRIYSYLYVSIHPLTIVTINFKMDGRLNLEKTVGRVKRAKRLRDREI